MIQSLTRLRLGTHQSYLIVIICIIKDNNAISNTIMPASVIFDCDYCSIKDKDAISIAAAVVVASVIFDCDYLHY